MRCRNRVTSPCIAIILLTLSGVSCGGWTTLEAPVPESPPVRQQWQIWESGHKVTWHSIRLGNDSVSGVPYFKSIDCAECRKSRALVGIHSIKVGSHERNFLLTAGKVAGGFAALSLIVGALMTD